MNSKAVLWQRTALAGGFAVAALALAFHTRMAWLYFRPMGGEWTGMTPAPGPLLLPAWAAHAGHIAAAAAFFASLPGLGRLWLRGAAAPPFAAAGLGLLTWGLAGFGLATAGLSSPAVLRGTSILLVAAGAFALHRERPRLPALSGLFWALGLFYLLTSLVPDTFYDAHVYHLAAPKAWLQAGRMTDMPDIHLWRLPGLLQPLYLWALAWADDRLCKLLNVGIGLLLAGHLRAWCGGRWGAAAGNLAAVLFLSSPIVGVHLWSCANDVPAAFFCFLALTCWIDGWAAGRRGIVGLAGLFFGAAVSVKTTAFFAAPYFLLDGLARARRGPARPALLGLAAFGAAAALPLLPWWIRNLLWTGNPFFPQAAALGGDRPENLALLKAWGADMRLEGGFFSRALSLARESLRGIEAGRFGFVGPVLLMFLPLFFFLRPDPAHGALAAYAGAAYLFFAAASGRLRYFIPHLPPLFALAGAALADYGRAAAAFPGRSSRRLERAMTLLAAAAVWLNLLWMAMAFHRFNQGWGVIWGRETADGYMKREHIGVYGHPSEGAFAWLRENGAAGRLFVVGEARTFRSPLPARASGNFNVPGFAPRAGDPPSAEALLAALQAEGFTHLLINVEEMKRITPAPYRSPAHLAALGTLFDRLAPPLYRDRWCILFKIP